MRKLPVLLLLLSVAGCARQPVSTAIQDSAQEDDAQRQRPNRYEGETRSTFPNLSLKGRNPTSEEIKRIRVEWDEPKRLDAVDPFNWCSPILELSGRVFIRKEGREEELVDWSLPLMAIISHSPDKRLDWSQGYDRENTKCDWLVLGREKNQSRTTDKGHEAVLLPKGTFIARFNLADLHTVPGQTRAFQIGLCLWGWEFSPLIPQTVHMMNIPGPKPINAIMQTINGCPTPHNRQHFPLRVIRIVNKLHPLGKEKIIASFRDFIQIAYHSGNSRDRIDPANIDTSSQYSLLTLVPLLFPNLVGKYDRIAVEQGIPFNTFVMGGGSGSPEFMQHLVSSAEAIGILLEKPLRPADNPLEAADSLFAKMSNPDVEEGVPSSEGYSLRTSLRRQAWRMIRHLTELPNPEGDELYYVGFDEGWKQLQAKVAPLKIRWDEQKQEYVIGATR